MSTFEFDPSRMVVTGANGLVGRALQREFPEAVFFGHERLGIDEVQQLDGHDWSGCSVLVNAAAYTDVNGTETDEGRDAAWLTNGFGVSALATTIAIRYDVPMVHFSSDYVFDGTHPIHDEQERPRPLNTFGHTKAYGDLVITSKVPKHLLIRTGWIFGEGGRNFPATMWRLATSGVCTPMVDDEVGRMTYADDLAAAVRHLLERASAGHIDFGIYNMTNSGERTSWANIAKLVYAAAGRSADDITPMPASERHAGNPHVAKRPQHSTFSLDKLADSGFHPPPWRERLEQYLGHLAAL